MTHAKSRLLLGIVTLILSIGSTAYSLGPDPSGNKVLWDAWYVIVSKSSTPTPIGFYQDHVEVKDKRVFFQNKLVKMENGSRVEESVGAFAKAELSLAPLFFNYRRLEKGGETIVDAEVKGSEVHGKFKTAKGPLNPSHAKLPKGTIFTSMFPVWLGLNLKTLKTGKPKKFTSVLEDATMGKFEIVKGSVQKEAPDAFSKSNETTKVRVNFGGKTSIWYVEPTGKAQRIDLIDDQIVAQLTTETEARASLKD